MPHDHDHDHDHDHHGKFDTRGIPRADSFRVMFCGSCPHAHLIFFDEAAKPLVHATMSAVQAREVDDRIHANDPDFREIGVGAAPNDGG